jgi:hypothetical protein
MVKGGKAGPPLAPIDTMAIRRKVFRILFPASPRAGLERPRRSNGGDPTRGKSHSAFLDQHEDRPKLIAWLREGGGDVWTTFLDDLEAASTGTMRQGLASHRE